MPYRRTYLCDIVPVGMRQARHSRYNQEELR